MLSCFPEATKMVDCLTGGVFTFTRLSLAKPNTQSILIAGDVRSDLVGRVFALDWRQVELLLSDPLDANPVENPVDKVNGLLEL
jgi:hypothetical protein